jgi:hypothetical protein
MTFVNKPLLIAVILSVQLLSCTQKPKEISYFNTHPNIDYQELKAGFNNVPQEAKMRAWWFWMSSNISEFLKKDHDKPFFAYVVDPNAPLNEQHISVRSERWRYTLFANGEEELYDHLYDPDKWANLSLKEEYLDIKSQHLKYVLELICQHINNE